MGSCALSMEVNFNSRPCERGDPNVHTALPGDGYFNSRPCERGDSQLVDLGVNYLNFNSRPCERGDRKRTACRRDENYFNSRPCERGDSKIKQNMLCFFCNYREKLLTFRQHQLS